MSKRLWKIAEDVGVELRDLETQAAEVGFVDLGGEQNNRPRSIAVRPNRASSLSAVVCTNIDRLANDYVNYVAGPSDPWL